MVALYIDIYIFRKSIYKFNNLVYNVKLKSLCHFWQKLGDAYETTYVKQFKRNVS